MTVIKCRKASLETIGDVLVAGSKSPNFTVCNGDFRLFNLNTDFKDKALVLFVIPSLDTETCMLCFNHFLQLVTQKKVNYLVITSDTPFAIKRITAKLPFNPEYVCTDMVLREFGPQYNLIVKSGPLASFLARSVFILNKVHEIQYAEVSNDIVLPINYQRLEEEIDRCFSH
jgi:peroxiredoxin